MSSSGRLQKAVEITIAAGYQIDREAFEFLSAISNIHDPADLMNKALQKMQETQEKPLFIQKSFLEPLLKEPETQKETKI